MLEKYHRHCLLPNLHLPSDLHLAINLHPLPNLHLLVHKKQAVLDNLFLKKRKFAEQSGDEEAQIHNQQSKKQPSSSLVQKESFSKPDPSSFPTDIANYVNASSLTDERKYHILCNVWRQSATYTFPLDNDQRKFRFELVELIPVASVFTKGGWSFLHKLRVIWFGM
jgi:hypothetical protein